MPPDSDADYVRLDGSNLQPGNESSQPNAFRYVGNTIDKGSFFSNKVGVREKEMSRDFLKE